MISTPDASTVFIYIFYIYFYYQESNEQIPCNRKFTLLCEGVERRMSDFFSSNEIIPPNTKNRIQNDQDDDIEQMQDNNDDTKDDTNKDNKEDKIMIIRKIVMM